MIQPPHRPAALCSHRRSSLLGRALPLVLFVLLALVARAQTELVDRIVAIVDDDPILFSEIERVIGLGLVERQPGESRALLERRVLDRLIDERLRLHQVDRFGFVEVPLDELESQLDAMAEAAGGTEALRQSLAEEGMTIEDLRAQLALQLQLLRFVEQRLGPRVSVSLEQIREYYDNELVPALEAQVEPDPDPDSDGRAGIPPVDEVREEIRALLYERALDRELVRWTNELRREADVIDLLERDERDLRLLDRREVPEDPPEERSEPKRPPPASAEPV